MGREGRRDLWRYGTKGMTEKPCTLVDNKDDG
jgi:hypothetical protein